MLVNIEEINKSGVAKGFYTTSDSADFSSPENYGEIFSAYGISENSALRASQTHTSYIRTVDKTNGGEGITRPTLITDYDGLVTGERGLLLLTVEADCTPVYLYDMKGRACGMIHSGWRGTADKISFNAAKIMINRFGCKPSDIFAVIGPHICEKCYEVGEELIPKFAETFGNKAAGFFTPEKDKIGKYYLNMSDAVRAALCGAGVPAENISDTRLCTFHGKNLCSFRRTGSRTERMLTGIMLI